MNAADSQPQSKWQRVIAALGFQVPVLAFALRTALAACVALVVAQAMGLEHPHWAAMSVWASSQPLREHLLSRGLYRVGGSIVGVVYAVALVWLAHDALWVLALGLALWGALCAFLGNLQRGYLVYGCMLAGYSAAMVVLLHQGPAAHIGPLAWDRMLTVVTGVATALCLSWCFAPRRKTAVLIAQSRHALAGVLQATLTRLRADSAPPAAQGGDVLSPLAQVEELLELYPEGSRTARYTSQAMHWQQHCAMELLDQLGCADRGAQATVAAPPTAESGARDARAAALEPAQAQAQQVAVVHALELLVPALQKIPQTQGASPAALEGTLHQAIAACAAWLDALQAGSIQGGATQGSATLGSALPGAAVAAALAALLHAMRDGLHAEARDLNQQPAVARAPHRSHALPLHLHRDWVGARQAAVRAGATLLVFGMVWAVTGSRLVAFGMLGLSVMLLVFSAFESPSRTMAFVLRGQLVGAALALLCQTLVWPLAQSSWQMVAMVLPFALIGGLVFAHPRTAAGAMDTNMAMFILLAPVFPDTASLGQHLSMALAVVSGPALAWGVYRWIYPTTGQHRLHTLARMMAQEIPAAARRGLQDGGALPSPGRGKNRLAQLHHRLLRLVRWADKTQWPGRAQLPDWGLSLRCMHTTLLQLQQWRRTTPGATPALRRTQRQAEVVFRRTAQWQVGAPPSPQRSKLHAAWQALAQSNSLPPALAAQVQGVAQHDLALVDALLQTMR